MIYLDTAATSYPKPKNVIYSVNTAFRDFGANPGRSGYKMAINTTEMVYRARKTVSDFFGSYAEENVSFTLNCTLALNMVIKGLLKKGDHVVVSCLEHNAVMRPLEALKEKGVSYTKALVYPQSNDETVNSFRKALRENTKLVIVTHASNVWGIRLPIERIAALCHVYEIPILVDCAQSAGYLPINMKEMGIDYLCAPGHKGLYGPMGTGILIAKNPDSLETIIEGGTGTNSLELIQPLNMPERFESGTVNVPGIIGLASGVSFVNKTGIAKIQKHGIMLTQIVYDELSKRKEIILYAPRPEMDLSVPTISFNVKGMQSEEVALYLAQKDIAVRAGLHCAPLAHEFYNTLDIGAVRISPSAFTSQKDIYTFLQTLMYIVKKH